MKNLFYTVIFFVFSLQAQAQWFNLVSGVPDNLYGVSFLNADTGFVCGGNIDQGLILKTTDGGAHWTPTYLDAYAWLYDIAVLNKDTIVACGHNGIMLRSTDAGTSWHTRPSNTTQWLYEFDFADGQNGYCAGLNGTILKTTDAGFTWYVKSTGITDWLLGVDFKDVNNGFAVGEDGQIIKTTDAGESWAELENEDPNFLSSIDFAGPDTGFIAGFSGTVFRTFDGGNSWFKLPSATVEDLKAVYCKSSKEIYIAGNGVIMVSLDAGETWSFMNYPVATGMESLCFATPAIAYTAGKSGTILKSIITIGLEENQRPEWTVYPNPANEFLFISGLPAEYNCYTIRDVSGRALRSGVTPAHYFPLYTSGLPDGMYILEASAEDGKTSYTRFLVCH